MKEQSARFSFQAAQQFQLWILRVGVKRLWECLRVHVCCASGPHCLLVAVAIWEGQACHTLLTSVQQVWSSFVVVSEGYGVLVQPRKAVGVGLQVGPLVVGEGHGKESLGIAHKLVHIPLTSHLRNKTKDIFDSHMKPPDGYLLI